MKYFFTLTAILIQFFCLGQIRTLDYFVQQAKQNSPLLKDYYNQIASNRLDSQILRATFQTQVNFINSANYAPVINGFGYDEAISNGANVSSLIQANRNFFTPGNV